MTGHRMARRGVLGLLAGGVAAVLSGCGSTNRFLYKMTVEVETPEGVKTGFAVREVAVRKPPMLPALGEDKGGVGLKGEAVAVDLPGGRTLFALLSSGDGRVDYAGRDVFFLFRELGGDTIQLWPNPPKTNSPRIANPLPMLVTFADLADPTSVQRVDPANLAASFGPGVTLKRITVEVTNDPVTTGIEKRLGWLPDKKRKRFDPDNKPEGIPLGNYSGLFSTELSK